VEDAILALYQRVDTLLPLSTRRIIQFIGPEGEEDVSSIARGFAYVAVKAGKSVLLIEGDQKNHSQKRFFNIKNSVSWMNALDSDTVRPEAIHKIGDIPLFISANSDGRQRSQQVALPKAFESFVRNVGQDFDLLVVDSSPAQKTNDGLMLSPLMDGIVLVVEANKTMSNAAEEIKDRILRSGGNLLGVVVSRERHYLPGLLARYMFQVLE
jgi:Mrp family chromosome partitioning ATPase